MKLDRNNTNFIIQLFEYFKNTSPGESHDFLKYYQNLVRIFISNISIESRGLLIYHTMGMGKSILAIAIIMELMDKYQPILLLTKSLQDNMKNAIKKYVSLRAAKDSDFPIGRLSPSELESWINHNFSFVSMNASNMINQMGKASEGNVVNEFDAVLDKKIDAINKINLNGKILVVDEAHNLFRAITNGSQNAMKLYEQVMDTKNCKLIFLTGTPIANDPFELVSCFNMLGSKIGKPLFPENYKDFKKLFIGEKGVITNKGKFQNRIQGLVSHVSHLSKPGKAYGIDANNITEFPEQLSTIVEYVNMDPNQYVQYQLARDKEKEEGTVTKFQKKVRVVETAKMTKPKSSRSTSYRTQSRQLSNYTPPIAYKDEKNPSNIPEQNLESPKFKKILSNINSNGDTLGLVYSQFVGVGGLGIFKRYLENNSWKEFKFDKIEKIRPEKVIKEKFDDGELNENDDIIFEGSWVPSVDEYLMNISMEGKKYNTTLDYNDTNIFPYLFEGGNEVKKYAIISGAVDATVRAKLQDTFNQDDNKHGGILDLLLISATGAEGLDLKNVRHIHIMEPYWNESRPKQVIARGVRNDSHSALEASEKNVQPYIYLAIPPTSEKSDSVYPDTTDTELYNDSLLNEIPIINFLSVLKEVAIECLANDEDYCRKCSPTNQTLFSDDIDRDARAVDPCTRYEEQQIKAEEIIIDDVKYYYRKDPSALYDYSIYIYNKSIDGYRKVRESEPIIHVIIEAIEAQENAK
jgi:superfamily II DNA or RNA helicase